MLTGALSAEQTLFQLHQCISLHTNEVELCNSIKADTGIEQLLARELSEMLAFSIAP